MRQRAGREALAHRALTAGEKQSVGINTRVTMRKSLLNRWHGGKAAKLWAKMWVAATTEHHAWDQGTFPTNPEGCSDV
jgi:hypothetical protein